MPFSLSSVLAIVGLGLISLVAMNLAAIPVTPFPVTSFEIFAMAAALAVGAGLLKYAIPRVRAESRH